MSETVCMKIKLKPGSLTRVREWASEMGRRSEEARQTLHEEGVLAESVYLDTVEGEDFLIYFMRAESLEGARRVSEKSTHPIDAYHQQFKRETWESSKKLEPLLDL